MVKVVVNDYKFVCSQKVTLLNLCRMCGLQDFKFCYHENLPIAGNCRICLIEIEEMDKQIAACVSNIEPNVSIWTENVFCKKARENVIETLLINHPLDCPICDQGGECDLQDQVRTVGGFKSRFFFNKRMIKDKNSGLFIKTIMTRCIHCLRCVRFNKLVGERVFGVINRSNRSEIVYHSFEHNGFDFNGVTVDLCPVGALTNRSYAFKCRPWELKLIESLDTSDCYGANLYVNYKESDVFKITPKSNYYINGNIISDRIRFSLDSYSFNRVKTIYKQNNLNQAYGRITWSVLLSELQEIVSKNSINVVINGNLDLESIFYLKKISYKFCDRIQVCNISNVRNTNLYMSCFSNFFFNLEAFNDSCLLFGTQLQIECTILNLKLRLKYKKSLISIFCLGRFFFDTFEISFLNLNIKKIMILLESKLKIFSYKFQLYSSILIFYSKSFFRNVFDIEVIKAILKKKLFSIKNIEISNNSNNESLNMSNIMSITKKKLNSFFFCINLEDNLKLRYILKKNYKKVLWFTTHKPSNSFLYNYIIPIASFLESESFYINVENRLQKTQQIMNTIPSIYNLLKSIFILGKLTPGLDFFYLNFLLEFIGDSSKNLRFFFSFNNLITEVFYLCDKTVVKLLILKSSLENNYCSNVWSKNSNFLNQALNLRKKKHTFFS